MKALRLHGVKNLLVEEVEFPQPGPDEVVLRVAAAGICATDLKAYNYGSRTKIPITLGHEIAGIVVEAGKNRRYLLDKRLTLNPNIFCGKCGYCLQGEQVLCRNRYALGIDVDGGFAEHVLVPAAAFDVGCVYEVPENLGLEEAALVEPLSDCLRGQLKLGVKPGDTIAIFGAGPIGAMHLLLAKAFGTGKTIVIEPNEIRATTAEKLGADHVLSTNVVDLEKEVQKITGGEGVDHVVVAVGVAEAQKNALKIVKPGGAVNYFAGLPAGAGGVEIDTNAIHYKQIRVLGTSMSTPSEFKKALDLVASRVVDLGPLITMTLPLENGVQGFAEAQNPRNLRVLLKP
ncbi:MAG: zinc-binding dehydrogenase [Candidatus Caldarchaeum sp.]|nr:zinc-binding dehydrogenase [Candidatus Caldarchaeum sp.]MDW8435073.1 zinc-binding dehydrogenase [Candidatus Caldarchaeum sp.]